MLSLSILLNIITFLNPVYDGADPWVVRDGGLYWSCWSDGRYLFVASSPTLTSRGTAQLVWGATSRSAWNRSEVWAPELHTLDGTWYLYYAADDGQNAHHRMGVLECDGPTPEGPWKEAGQLYTGGRWAIDGTVLTLGNRRYFLWSGWPGDTDGVQNLCIAPMESPVSIKVEPVVIARPEFPWERGALPLIEGPEVLQRGGRTFVVYSTSGSWTASYALGMLELKPGADPLDPVSWTKSPRPVFAGTPEVPGPGHASFTVSPDGTQDWIVYHAKKSAADGWDRNVRLQSFGWVDGRPDFGTPVSPGAALALPSGDPGSAKE
jgi:GH43 family beta-xylosidase